MSATDKERFFEMSLDMLCVASFDGYFLELNSAWEKALGYTRAELTAAPFTSFVHPDDISGTAAETGKLAGGHLTVSFTNRYRHKEGHYVVLLWTATPDPQRELIYAVARDITEQQRTSNELVRLNQELENRVEVRTHELLRSNRDLERFAYVISHDLREPLRTVSSFVQLLAEEAGQDLSEDAAEYMSYAMNACKRMRTQLDDLLAYSLVAAEPRTSAPADTDAIVGEVLKDLHTNIESRAASVAVSSLPPVAVPPSLVRQLFLNLISNALKFTGDAAPAIKISAESAGAFITFSVIDNGPGVPEQHSADIFEVFRRLHGRRDYPGNGIGLAICRRIVESVGGRIWVENTDPSGAVFHFTLPGGKKGGARRDADPPRRGQ